MRRCVWGWERSGLTSGEDLSPDWKLAGEESAGGADPLGCWRGGWASLVGSSCPGSRKDTGGGEELGAGSHTPVYHTTLFCLPRCLYGVGGSENILSLPWASVSSSLGHEEH